MLTDTYKITIKDDVFFEVEGKVRRGRRGGDGAS